MSPGLRISCRRQTHSTEVGRRWTLGHAGSAEGPDLGWERVWSSTPTRAERLKKISRVYSCLRKQCRSDSDYASARSTRKNEKIRNSVLPSGRSVGVHSVRKTLRLNMPWDRYTVCLYRKYEVNLASIERDMAQRSPTPPALSTVLALLVRPEEIRT